MRRRGSKIDGKKLPFRSFGMPSPMSPALVRVSSGGARCAHWPAPRSARKAQRRSQQLAAALRSVPCRRAGRLLGQGRGLRRSLVRRRARTVQTGQGPLGDLLLCVLAGTHRGSRRWPHLVVDLVGYHKSPPLEGTHTGHEQICTLEQDPEDTQVSVRSFCHPSLRPSPRDALRPKRSGGSPLGGGATDQGTSVRSDLACALLDQGTLHPVPTCRRARRGQMTTERVVLRLLSFEELSCMSPDCLMGPPLRQLNGAHLTG